MFLFFIILLLVKKFNLTFSVRITNFGGRNIFNWQKSILLLNFYSMFIKNK